MRPQYFFLPPNLKINDVKIALTGYRDKAKLVDQACLLYHVLSLDLIKQRENDTTGAYTQVHFTKLINIFDDEYKKPVDLLLSANLLEMKVADEETGEYREEGVYSKARKTSRAFRIPPKLLSNDKLFIKSPVDKTNKVLVNKLKRLRNLTETQEKLIETNRLLVLKNMDRIVLLDNDHSRAIIANHYTKQNLHYTDQLITSHIELFNTNPVKRHRICLFASRLHTEITNKLKALRQDFRFENYLDSRLAEIDIRASQPWFLSCITPARIKKFVPECADACPIFKRYRKHPDWLKFKELCLRKEDDYGIYEFFRDKYNEMYEEEFTRNDAKKICYRAFFSNYKKHSRLTLDKCQQWLSIAYDQLVVGERYYQDICLKNGYPVEQKEAQNTVIAAKRKVKLATSLVFTHKCITMLQTALPGVYDLLSEIKELKWDFERGSKTKRVKSYANPALLAQRIEANIVYTVVVKALVEKNITDIVTIHDSFVVREEQKVKAEAIIRKAFKSIGIKPTLK